MKLYDEIADKNLLVRRVTIAANNLIPEKNVQEKKYEQIDLFTDYDELMAMREKENARLEKERNLQEAMIKIKSRYGKNAIIKCGNLQEGATSMERNRQIGGHRA